MKLISSKCARSGSSGIRVSTNTLFRRSALIYINTRSLGHVPPEFATKTSKAHRPRVAPLSQKPIKVKRNIVEGAPQHKTKSLWISLQNLSSNPHFTVNDCNSFLSQLMGRQSHLVIADTLWELMKQRGVKPNTKSYNIYFRLLQESANPGKIMALAQQMAADNVPLDMASYECVVWAANKQDNLTEMNRLVEVMGKQGLKPSLFIKNIILQHLAKNNLSQALKMLKEMEDEGALSRPSSYLIVINQVLKTGDKPRALYWLKKMLRRVTAFPTADQWYEILSHVTLAELEPILQQTNHSAAELENCMHAYVQESLWKKNLYDQVTKYVDCMNKAGMDVSYLVDKLKSSHKQPLTADVESTLLASLTRNIAKEKRKAEREKAKNGGTTAETPVTTPVAPIKISKPPNRETKPPNPIKESTTFNLLLKSIGTPAFTSFNTQPAPEPVSTPVEKIESVRSYVEEDFNVMIERCGAKGDLEMMVVWFNDMIALNVKPSTETLNLLIDGFIQHIESKPDQIENLLKCWHKAVQVGVKVDAVSYQLLASAFQLIGDEENEDKCNQIAKLMDQQHRILTRRPKKKGDGDSSSDEGLSLEL